MSSANNVVGAFAAYMVQGTAATNVSNVANAKNSSQTAATSFDSVLNKVSDTFVQAKTTDVSKQTGTNLNDAKQTGIQNAPVKQNNISEKGNNVENTENNTNMQDAQVVEEKAQPVDMTNETKGTEADTKLQEAITENVKELIGKITETFDVTEEDVVNAMQVLGLMAADLLQPANLQMLITQVTGEEEAIDLLTDSDIYTSLQDLMEGAESMKSELMNEFDLSEEGLQTAIEDNKKNFAEQLQTPVDENPIISDNTRNFSTKDMNVRQKDAPQSEAFTDETPATRELPEITVETSKNSGNNRENFQQGAESSNLFNQVIDNIAEAAAADTSSTVSYTDRAQMQDIIRQITDRISISASSEETTMELSLHPASLGNVNILLSSGKDGIVAKFTAQNQIVKEAVEAQMVQLQQKFDEQGIKVTSIEVTIASHGFEQNLEQGNDRHPGEAAEERKVKPLRRINLSELEDEEVEEITSDAERIAVQMMAANGNSVDFSA